MATHSSHHVGKSDTPKHTELDALREGYTSTHRAWEIFFLLAFSATTFVLGYQVWNIATAMTTTSTVVVVVALGWLLGVLAADIGSGLVHWAADNWGSVDMPVLGESMIRTFRLHHLDPKEMTTHDFIELNGFSSLFAQLPIMMGFVCLFLWPPLAVFFGVFSLVMGTSTVFTNQIHAWAHKPNPPGVARFLQRYHIILTPQNHAKHHSSPYDCHYCITTGWCNQLFRRIRAFERIEWFITKLTGIRPQHDIIEEQHNKGS